MELDKTIVPILFSARKPFSKNSEETQMGWNKFIEWSRLFQLKELVSLDSSLNESVVEFDDKTEEDWNFVFIDEYSQTDFYKSIDYVTKRIKNVDHYNLLAISVSPVIECNQIEIPGFKFIGYDLLDKSYDISALSNCGGFDETFLPEELNDKGLIDSYSRAYEINKNLLENNPEEYHADTNVIAVWRHQFIGKKETS